MCVRPINRKTTDKFLKNTKRVDWICSIQIVFLKLLQNSKENVCAEVFFLINFKVGFFNVILKSTPLTCFPVSFPVIYFVELLMAVAPRGT